MRSGQVTGVPYFILWWERSPRRRDTDRIQLRFSKAQMKRSVPFLIIAIVLVVALGVMWKMSSSSRQSGGPPPVGSPSPGSLPLGATPAHVRGNANAPVTVEEFADFQCPSCGAYYP